MPMSSPELPPGPEDDLRIQLSNAVAHLRAANPALDLADIVAAGTDWRLPRGQKVFRALEQFAGLAGLTPLPSVPGRADADQRSRFVDELQHLIAC